MTGGRLNTKIVEKSLLDLFTGDVLQSVDDEEYHEALFDYRAAPDLMKEARVGRGFYPVLVPFRSDKPTGRGKGESSGGKNVSGMPGRGKGGRGSNCS